jgi:2,3-bisphosphoglycerate-dependent phosphoglycerate mutase
MSGLNKAESAARFGAEQVLIWRRSYDIPPPALDPSDQRWAGRDRRYLELEPGQPPATPCLKDTVRRLLPYWG